MVPWQQKQTVCLMSIYLLAVLGSLIGFIDRFVQQTRVMEAQQDVRHRLIMRLQSNPSNWDDSTTTTSDLAWTDQTNFETDRPANRQRPTHSTQNTWMQSLMQSTTMVMSLNDHHDNRIRQTRLWRFVKLMNRNIDELRSRLVLLETQHLDTDRLFTLALVLAQLIGTCAFCHFLVKQVKAGFSLSIVSLMLLYSGLWLLPDTRHSQYDYQHNHHHHHHHWFDGMFFFFSKSASTLLLVQMICNCILYVQIVNRPPSSSIVRPSPKQAPATRLMEKNAQLFNGSFDANTFDAAAQKHEYITDDRKSSSFVI